MYSSIEFYLYICIKNYVNNYVNMCMKTLYLDWILLTLYFTCTYVFICVYNAVPIHNVMNTFNMYVKTDTVLRIHDFKLTNMENDVYFNCNFLNL